MLLSPKTNGLDSLFKEVRVSRAGGGASSSKNADQTSRITKRHRGLGGASPKLMVMLYVSP